MIGFKLNQDNTQLNAGFNDIYIDNAGNIVVTNEYDDLIQTITNVIWLWYGEYDFNNSLGIPYKKILGNKLDDGLVSYYIVNQILNINTYMDTISKEKLNIEKVIVKSLTLDRINNRLYSEVVVLTSSGLTLNMSISNANN